MTLTEILLAGILFVLLMLFLALMTIVQGLTTLIRQAGSIGSKVMFLPQHQVKVERALDKLVEES